MSMVELRRNSSPPHLTSPQNTQQNANSRVKTTQNTNRDPHMSLKTASASPTVWRKTSHPPLNFNNNERRHIDLQLQLKNVGTKDDWAMITCDFMTEAEDFTAFYRDISHCDDFDDADMPSTSAAADSSSPTTPRMPSSPSRSVSPTLYQRLLLQSDDLNNLMRSIMEEAKRMTNAETCSLFLVDNENNELVARIFDQGGENVSELRVPMEHGVVGRVATTKTMMNVREAQRCPFFYAHVDEITGFRTRNILCFPIIDNAGTFVGVAELCNKRGVRGGFNRIDEKLAKTFAVYCATSISHCQLYKKVQEATRRSHMASEMTVQGSQHMVDEEEVLRLEIEPIRPWPHWHENFANFAFSPRSIGDECFSRATITMFDDLGFITRYRMNKGKLACFILRVAAGYRDVPYHNWSHAFAVAHFCWLTLRTRATRLGLDELERLSLLIACLCHDIDHRGTNNTFQVKSKTPLAQLYSSEGSVLERHHYAQSVAILQKPECNLLEQLTAVQYKTVLSHIRDVILATDIAAHINKASRIRQMVDKGYDALSPDHHYLFTCLVMTASDLSDQSKNFHNSKAIAENIYKEFFAQGDLEQELGQKPQLMMDRENAYVPSVQLEFMDSIGLPVFEMLSKVVPEGASTYEAISANRRCWQALDEELKVAGRQDCHGLDFLKDEELEKRVIERVRKEDPAVADAAIGPLVLRSSSHIHAPRANHNNNTVNNVCSTSGSSANSTLLHNFNSTRR